MDLRSSQVKVVREKRCEWCNGRGSSYRVECAACDGSGKAYVLIEHEVVWYDEFEIAV